MANFQSWFARHFGGEIHAVPGPKAENVVLPFRLEPSVPESAESAPQHAAGGESTHTFEGSASGDKGAPDPFQALSLVFDGPVSITVRTPSGEKMSAESVLNDIGGDLKLFGGRVAAEWQKAKQAWVLISSPQTRAFMVKCSTDTLQAIKDGEAAAAANIASPVALTTLQLDAQLVADGKQLLADAKAGEGVIVTDLKVLGFKL